jgi:hypothetical protein
MLATRDAPRGESTKKGGLRPEGGPYGSLDDAPAQVGSVLKGASVATTQCRRLSVG